MTQSDNRAFWILRICESLLLLGMLVGIGTFAWSLVDIVRIETGTSGATSVPPSAWPGVAIFGGSLVLLQVVRIVLQRYRRADGTPRGDERGRAAMATTDALGTLDASDDTKTDTGDGA